MSPERWQRIRDTFDLALDEPEDRRLVAVRSACAGEPELEAEVLQLLRSHDTSGDFLEDSVAHLHDFLQPSGPALQPGTVLNRRFEIRAFISAGGMGEVYEAWDTELGEAVALKTILPHIAANRDIIDRFKHEVRHAREVSHRNICRVHELFCDETPNGSRTWFLTMELLRGTTLLERIRSTGALTADEAASVAGQLIDGLEAAHARGLVHRDFKSSNIMLMQETPVRAVIMDFGLALPSVPVAGRPSDMPGTGTPGYMAPEQAQGEDVGPLADQYSLGVVLCEMMTGALPSAGGSTGRFFGRGTRSRVAGDAPKTAEQAEDAPHGRDAAHSGQRRGGYPHAWQAVIRRCTLLDPSARFRDMAAVRAALLPSFLRRYRVWLIAAALLLTVGAVEGVRRNQPIPPKPCSVCDVTQFTPDTDKSESPSLSADGRFVAYSSDGAGTGNLDIFVQALPSGPLHRVTNDAARDTTPTLSPDGRTVAFRSERQGGGIFVAETGLGDEGGTQNSALPSGSPDRLRLLAAGGRNPRFSPDGSSVVYWTGDPSSSEESGKVYRIALNGGTPQRIAADFGDARYPVWSSDGDHVLFTGCSAPGQLLPDCFDWWVGSVTGNTVAPTNAFNALRNANFTPGRLGPLEWRDGEIVFSAVGEQKRLNLAALSLDRSSFMPVGAPRWLLQGQGGGDLEPSIAVNGRMAFTRTSGALHIWRLQAAPEHKRPPYEKVTTDTEVDGSPFIAEGGRYLVFARGRTLKRTILLHDTSTGQEKVIVDHGTPVQSPILDSTGTWLAYQQTESDGASAIYAGQVGGTFRRICTNCTEPSGWMNGDRGFFFRDGAHAISLADPRTGQKTVVLRDPTATMGDANWSPALNALILIVSRGGARQIQAVHLDPGTAHPQGAADVIHTEPGTPVHPRWISNGKGIVYVSNRDGYLCVYMRAFHPATHTFGEEVAVAHFHNQRVSIDDVVPRVFNVSVDGETIYLNLGEQNSTVELGWLRRY